MDGAGSSSGERRSRQNPASEEEYAVPLARIVVQEIAALRQIRSSRAQWRSLQRLPTWYTKLIDIPLKITCLAPLYRQLGVVPVAGQIDGALKHLDEQEKLALQRLGKIMQWQHATLPAARLLGHKPIVRASSPVVDSLLVLLQRSTSGAPPSDDGRVHALNVRAQQLAIGTPSWLHCYWPWFIVGAVGLWSTSRIWRALNLTQIVGDYLGNLNITVQRFAKERLWDPLVQMYKTVRYDDNQFAAQSAKSLESDMDSLKRMVLAFGAECLNMSDADLTVLKRQVEEGDMTPIMKKYEQELKHPVRALALGDMLRTTLIQVQKSKVDMQMALSAMDKLLKSNELVFQLLALLPAILIAGGAVALLLRLFRRRHQNLFFRSAGDLRRSLLDVVRAAHQASKSPSTGEARLVGEGRLLYTCYTMAQAVQTSTSLSGSAKEQLVRDLEELLVAGSDEKVAPDVAGQRRYRVSEIIKLALETKSGSFLWG